MGLCKCMYCVHLFPSGWYCLGKSLGSRPGKVILTPSYSLSLLSGPPWCELCPYVLVGTDRTAVLCFSHHGGKRALWNCDPKLNLFPYMVLVTYFVTWYKSDPYSTPCPDLPSAPLVAQASLWFSTLCFSLPVCGEGRPVSQCPPHSAPPFFFWITVLCSSGWSQTH